MVTTRSLPPRRHISGRLGLRVGADVLILVPGVGGQDQGVGPFLGDVQVAGAGAGHRVDWTGAKITVNVGCREGGGVLQHNIT